MTDKTFALKSFSILEDLNSFELENFASSAELFKFGKNENIYLENSTAEKVFFVFHGKVKLACLATCGKTLIKDIVHKHDIFGENIFHEGNNRTEYAQATEAGTMVFSVDKKQILNLVARNKAFADKLINIIMVRMNNLEQRMQNFIFLKAKSRISEFIGRMGSQRGIKIGLDEWLINHGLSHKEIAYMTDTSRQTVARVLGELKNENLIHFSARKPSKILIRNIAALRAV